MLAGHRQAHGCADETGLGDRRLDDPLRAETVQQPFGDLEHTAVYADVFAQQQDVGVVLHLLDQGLAQGFGVG